MSIVARANAEACAALFAEWVRQGVRHVVASPGSRSTPLTLAAADAADRGDLALHIQLDERAAAFMALGIGLHTGTPAVIVCTSGTAAVNFAPAVVEAGLSNVPLLVATADRPPELRGRGAPQTIDQLELYGRSVRAFVDLPTPDEAPTSHFAQTARASFEMALTGPVHLNLPFREPLLAAETVADQPATSDASARPLGTPGAATNRPTTDPAANGTGDRSGAFGSIYPSTSPSHGPLPPSATDARRGVFVAGGRSQVDNSMVGQIAERLGWPIIADPLSGLRRHPNAITAADALLRDETCAARLSPDLVIRVGRPPASKAVGQWTGSTGCPIVQVGGPGLVDPDHNVTAFCDLTALDALSASVDPAWLDSWLRLNGAAESAIDDVLDATDDLSEPRVAREVAQLLHDDDQLVVASSMPVRDLEWFGGPSARAIANRGANGIDGVMSTALGVALTGAPTKVLIGDLAMVHDSNALVGIVNRNVDLTIIVNDNDGGGIFSFLPQATILDTRRFETLFGTPSGADISALARAHGVDVIDVSTASELRHHLAVTTGTVRLIRSRTNRTANVDIHHQLNAAVAAAVATVT